MTLSRRTAAIVLLLLLATTLATHLVQQYVVYPRFLELEREQSRRNAELVLEVMTRELALLAPQSQDWAYWDETYKFMGGQNPAYVDTNLIPTAQQSLDTQLLAFYDNDGRKVWSRGLDMESLEPLDFDIVRGEIFPGEIDLLVRSDAPVLRTGLIDTNLGLLFVTAAPILTGYRKGPQRGTVIMGRLFEPQALRRIASQNHLSLQLSTPQAYARPPPPSPPGEIAVRHSALEFATGTDAVRVSTQVFGLTGKPALGITIATPREISARGARALQLSLVLLVLAGMSLMGLLLWALHREILEPLGQLTRSAGRIGADGEQEARLKLQRDDEIGELAEEFDRMLDRLADTRQRLLEQSYKAGASEMAGGIIRDLRESLGPLRERLEAPLRLLDQAQTSGQQMLLQQLGDPGTSPPKQAELLQLLQENTSAQASVLAEARAELRLLRRKLEESQNTLNEYARYLESRATLSTVSVSATIDGALRTLGPLQRSALILDIDHSVARAGDVIAAREVLQQVVALLMAEAARALQALPGGQGHLRITALVEPAVVGERVHLRFDDSRPTPSAGSIESLFGAEPVEEMRNDGLSLAWAASAITAMNGELYARASQPYDGLVVHLILPRARD